MLKNELTPIGSLLEQSVHTVRKYDRYYAASTRQRKVHVPTIGTGLSVAYEQLRNASENIEDSLLRQSAILRFYRRTLSFTALSRPKNIGYELLTELTQAEYISNDTYTNKVVAQLDTIVTTFYSAYWRLLEAKVVDRAVLQRWILEILAVQSDQVFDYPARVLSFANLAYSQLSTQVNVAHFIVEGEVIQPEDYQKILYIAIHKALLKSDTANIRNALLTAYHVSIKHTASFIAFNQRCDQLVESKTTARLAHLVNYNGAPLLAIRSTFLNKKNDNSHISFQSRSMVLSSVDEQLDRDYRQVKRAVNRGITKSIIFLLITKALVGLFVEVPYDIITTGHVALLPLAVNFTLPPLAIVFMALTIRQPSLSNKQAVTDYVEAMIYKGVGPTPLIVGSVRSKRSLLDSIYAVLAIGMFVLIGWGLATLGFNLVQGIIFFLFISTALFLGYRLTLQVRELELVTNNRSGLELLRDFIQIPFIFLGQKISYRFSKINITARILDGLIDLPLKTVLKLIRQWSVFLANKTDELL